MPAPGILSSRSLLAREIWGAEDISRVLSLRRGALRGRHRPDAADVPVQLLDLLAEPILGGRGEAQRRASAAGPRRAGAIPVQLHAERAPVLQNLRSAPLRD